MQIEDCALNATSAETSHKAPIEVVSSEDAVVLPDHVLKSLASIKKELAKNRDLKIAAADKIKKLQIQNIHELFAYEKDEAEAVYEVGTNNT